jgi:hypothetical protein
MPTVITIGLPSFYGWGARGMDVVHTDLVEWSGRKCFQ